MKVCLYSPYIPKHFGGGEKYLFTVAQVYAQKSLVYIAVTSSIAISPQQNIRLRKLYEEFLGETLHKNINFIASPLGTQSNFVSKLLWTKQFDVMYFATDGSLFFSLAKRNILHIQVPFMNSHSSLVSRIKLNNWQVKNTNSNFTKKIIEKYWQTKINYVHHPVIVDEKEIEKVNLEKKEKIILHVGRFFKQLHSKRQDILVSIFAKLKAADWKLVLIGSVEDESYLNEVKDMAKGLNIDIKTKVSHKQLIGWYKKASIYWHATGFGVSDSVNPEKVEHFGISTVEAMSYGCAPIVIKKGGQKEILKGDLKKWLWNDKNECVLLTRKLIRNKKSLIKIQEKAIARSKEFSYKKFSDKLWKMTNE
ncbi:MAG: glycosyltransferase family 4 protein [Candidatus Pacebacteria bacterium]|nr:glycosyltransferase family 4 protein [Candidatus Paceibacterota bacterium]